MKGYAAVLGAAGLWASSGTLGKGLFSSGVTPLDLVQVRTTVSSLCLALLFACVRPDILRIQRRDLWRFLLLGSGFMALVQVTYFCAIKEIPVAAAIFLQYLSPLLVALWAFLSRQESFTGTKAVSLCLCLCGSYLVAGGYSLSLLSMNRVGIAYSVVSALAFSGYTLLGERLMHRYSPWTVLFYSLLFAALSLHVFHPPFRYLLTPHTLLTRLGMLYVAILGTLIPFGLFFVGVNHIRSTRATITATMEPILAGVFAYLLLGERLEGLQILGGALVAGAIVALQLQRETDLSSPYAIRRSRQEAFKGEGSWQDRGG